MKIIQIQVLPAADIGNTIYRPRMVALTDDGKILERFEIDCAWGNWHEIDAPAPALAPGIKIKIVNGCDPYFKAGDVATLDCLDQYGCWWGTFADGKQWSIGTEEDFEVLT